MVSLLVRPTQACPFCLGPALKNSENHVQLPDEYDQIHNDLRLFWALSPAESHRRMEDARQNPMTWTIFVRDGKIGVSRGDHVASEGITQERIYQQLELIQDIAGFLPDLDAVHSMDDAPSQFIGYNHQIELEHYENGEEYFDAQEEIDTTNRGWQAACSILSPLGVAAEHAGAARGTSQNPNLFRPAPFGTDLEGKTFIQDHRAAMHPCQHPNLIPIHSAFASKSPVVGPLIPLFSLSKTTLHADILGVPTEQFGAMAHMIPWRYRYRNTLLWRGRTTGPDHRRLVDWPSTQRTRLVRLGNIKGPTDAGDAPVISMLGSGDETRGSSIGAEAITTEIEYANANYLDVAFAGNPIRMTLRTTHELTRQSVGKQTVRARLCRITTRSHPTWAPKQRHNTSM